MNIQTLSRKEITANINNYLLNVIDGENYGKVLNIDTEKLQFVADIFKSEYGYMIRRIGYQPALKEWFSGLPSAINIDFGDYRIIELAKEFGSLPDNATENQEDKIIANWFNYMAYKLVQLFRKNKINF
jgi:hypothetical protein